MVTILFHLRKELCINCVRNRWLNVPVKEKDSQTHTNNRTRKHGPTITNHHVLLYLLVSGCQSVFSAVGGLVSTAVALWPRLPLVLWQVPVGQRQRPQAIRCILLEPNIYTQTYTDILTWGYTRGETQKSCRMMVLYSTITGSEFRLKKCQGDIHDLIRTK